MLRCFAFFYCFFWWMGGLYAQEGKALFRNKCRVCHEVSRAISGPALKGVRQRVPDTALLYAWIRNSKKVLATGNTYFNDLFVKWHKLPMNNFEDLSDMQIKAILDYVDDVARREEQTQQAIDLDAAEKPPVLLLAILAVIIVSGVFLVWFNAKKKKMRHKEGTDDEEIK